MEISANLIGYGAGFAARSYFGISYLHEIRQGIEDLVARIASRRIGTTVGQFVGKQASYILAFPCVNLAGEVVGFVIGSVTSRIVGVAVARLRGKEEERPSRLALVTGLCFAFVVKNVVAFHSVEPLYAAIKGGAGRATVIYLGEGRKMSGPISNAVGLQVAMWGAFPAASIVGDTAGWGVKKTAHKSIALIESRLRRSPSAESGEGEGRETQPLDQ